MPILLHLQNLIQTIPRCKKNVKPLKGCCEKDGKSKVAAKKWLQCGLMENVAESYQILVEKAAQIHLIVFIKIFAISLTLQPFLG